MVRSVGFLLAGIVLIALGALANAIGFINFGALNPFPDVATVETGVIPSGPPRITKIEPISLVCEARVHAEVPVSGERKHQVLGKTYSTDTVTMMAYGDVDTCANSDGVQITYNEDGSAAVVIDARSIRLERPRVDAVRTAETVQIDNGTLGQLADALPWVDENQGLTPTAYAFAQNVIGGSECSKTAWALTEELLIAGYRKQAIDQGADPGRLSVTIEGEPRFPDPPALVLDGATMKTGDITCSVGPGRS